MLTRTVEYNGMSLQVSTNEHQSSDHWIVALHGLACSKASFDCLFAEPRLKEFSICAVDFPGSGSSPAPHGVGYSLDDHAAIVKCVIDQIGPAKLSLVAHSMGGAIGLILVRNGIEIEHFVSVEGNLVPDDCGYASRLIAGQSLEEFLEGGHADFLRTLEVSDRLDLRTWSNWFRQADPRSIHAAARSLVNWSDSHLLLESFNALPTKTYMHGDEDAKEFLIPHLVDTPVISVSNSGHFAMIDNPAQFCGGVADALA